MSAGTVLRHDSAHSACYNAGLQALMQQVKLDAHIVAEGAQQQYALATWASKAPGQCGIL